MIQHIAFSILCGIAGGLIGFGVSGSPQAVCLGAGIGLLAPFVLGQLTT